MRRARGRAGLGGCLVAGLLGCGPATPRDAGTDLGALDAIVAPDLPWVHPDVSDDAGMGSSDGAIPRDRPSVDRELPDDPRVNVLVTDGLRGEGLPCKLTIEGVEGTRDPHFGEGDQRGVMVDRDNRAIATGRWVLMPRGRASFMLPPGRYRFRVTRGTEYDQLDLGVVNHDGRRGPTLRGELHRVVNTEGEVSAEFHVHSEPSFDCDVPLEQRVLSLAVEGVEVFASTDHDIAGDFRPAIRFLGLERHIHWMKGDEITADGFGHFGAYPLPEAVDPARDLTHDEPNLMAILDRARRVAPGVILQLNHPMWNEYPIGYWSLAGFDPTTGMSRMALSSLFDTVEVWNGHNLNEPLEFNADVDQVIDTWMATLQLGFRAAAVGNSDSHRLTHNPPGWPHNYLRVANDDPGEVTDAMVTMALRARDVSLTSGPYLQLRVNNRRPGELAPGPEARVSVEVQAPAWIPLDTVEIIANRRVMANLTVTATPERGLVRQRFELPLPLRRDAWVLARTRARAPLDRTVGAPARPMPSLALTNPVYVDFDNNGRYEPPGIQGGP